MKNITQVFLCLFFSTSALFAQPILTASNTNPQIGDAFSYHIISSFMPGAAGPNANWDFSTIASTASGNEAFTFKDVADLPNAAKFPGANMGFVDANGTEGYFLISADSQNFVGTISGPIEVEFNRNSWSYLQFPMAYNDSFADGFRASIIQPGSVIPRYGMTRVHADAYGTLTLPYGTFQDVMRVKTVATYKDSTDLLGLISTSVETRYQWFKAGIRYPLLSYALIESVSFGVPSTIARYSYMEQSSALSIDDLAADLAFSFFPNPASDQLTLTYTLKERGLTTLALTDLIGRELISRTLRSAPGLEKTILDVSSLAAGTYLLKLTSDDRHLIRKVIIK